MRSMPHASDSPADWPSFDAASRPEFGRPPVVEVVLSCQFSPLMTLGMPHVGLLWDRYRLEFTEFEDKPALPHVVEHFGPSRPSSLEFRVVTEPAPERAWFKTKNGTHMLQIQRDRFILNWRRSNWTEPYPRYPSVKKRFIDNFNRFDEFVNDFALGVIEPDQCEVTYVNHIYVDEHLDSLGQLERILQPWSGNRSDDFLSAPEEAAAQAKFRISDVKGNPIGRLHIKAEPRLIIGSGRQLIQLTLTARGAPHSASLSGVLAFFDLGREYVVRGFTSITTLDMHKAWERQ